MHLPRRYQLDTKIDPNFSTQKKVLRGENVPISRLSTEELNSTEKSISRYFIHRPKNREFKNGIYDIFGQTYIRHLNMSHYLTADCSWRISKKIELSYIF